MELKSEVGLLRSSTRAPMEPSTGVGLQELDARREREGRRARNGGEGGFPGPRWVGSGARSRVGRSAASRSALRLPARHISKLSQ